MKEFDKDVIEIGKEIWKAIRDELLIKFRYFDIPLFSLDYVPSDVKSILSDGRNIYASPLFMAKMYRSNREELKLDILHILLHGLYFHFFPNPSYDLVHWNLACDIFVESILMDLTKNGNYKGAKSFVQEPIIESIKNEIGILSAEKIYYHLLEKGMYDDQLAQLEKQFYRDNHNLWYHRQDKDPNIENEFISMDDEMVEQLSEKWKKISQSTAVKLETGRKSMDTELLEQSLLRVNQEKFDYGDFLRKFSTRGEDIKIDEDEFDYIYYTYGLKLYGNIPLINPLEYKEVNKIKDLVIAIDTSGSVKNKLVRLFVQKTYNILKQTSNFFTKVNIHIIQCDKTIQSITKLDDIKDFGKYIDTIQVKGFGGTDYRPVFEYVDKMVKNHQFINLKGIIYFTDGYGKYPSYTPSYKSAFVFMDHIPMDITFPIWAIKMILTTQDLMEENNEH